MKESFNLIDEPWIKVFTKEGKIEVVGIRDALKKSHEYVGLSHRAKTMDFAILRVLLAIVHRAYENKLSVKEWGSLWKSKSFDQEKLDTYLKTHYDRFNLIDDDAPFYQTPGLDDPDAKWRPLSYLFLDYSIERPYKTSRSDDGLKELTYPEAARELIHYMSYCIGGIKGGSKKDPTTTSGKTYGNRAGWCGQIGAIVPTGKDFFDTLMLNLTPMSANENYDPTKDLPVWEKPVLTPARNTDGIQASGPVDLYTAQPSRILLKNKDGMIRKIILCGGDKIEMEGKFGIETHTQWRIEQQGKTIAPIPKKRGVDQYSWKALSQYIIPTATRVGKSLPPEPTVVSNLRGPLMRFIDDDYVVRYEYIGASYNDKMTVILEACGDHSDLSMVGVRESGDDNAVSIETVYMGVESVINAVRRYTKFEVSLRSSPGSGKEFKETVQKASSEEAYKALDRVVREWMSELGLFDGHKEALESLYGRVKRLLLDMAEEKAAHCPTSYWINGDPTSDIVNPGKALNFFVFSINKILPTTKKSERRENSEL